MAFVVVLVMGDGVLRVVEPVIGPVLSLPDGKSQLPCSDSGASVYQDLRLYNHLLSRAITDISSEKARNERKNNTTEGKLKR